jgi:hypothetical protein
MQKCNAPSEESARRAGHNLSSPDTPRAMKRDAGVILDLAKNRKRKRQHERRVRNFAGAR